MLTRSVVLQKLPLLSAASKYKIEVGRSCCFTPILTYSVRQASFEITCAIGLLFFQSFLSSKFFMGANAEAHECLDSKMKSVSSPPTHPTNFLMFMGYSHHLSSAFYI